MTKPSEMRAFKWMARAATATAAVAWLGVIWLLIVASFMWFVGRPVGYLTAARVGVGLVLVCLTPMVAIALTWIWDETR